MSGATGKREFRTPTPTERLHEVTLAFANRTAAPPESSVEISRNARGVFQFTVTVRHPSAATAEVVAKDLAFGLAAEFPYPSENGGTDA
jgi:hypothetical protein